MKVLMITLGLAFFTSFGVSAMPTMGIELPCTLEVARVYQGETLLGSGWYDWCHPQFSGNNRGDEGYESKPSVYIIKSEEVRIPLLVEVMDNIQMPFIELHNMDGEVLAFYQVEGYSGNYTVRIKEEEIAERLREWEVKAGILAINRGEGWADVPLLQVQLE